MDVEMHEGAARRYQFAVWMGIVLILITGLVHFVDASSSFQDAAYKGVLFAANGIGSLVAAYGISRGERHWGWGLGLLVAGGRTGRLRAEPHRGAPRRLDRRYRQLARAARRGLDGGRGTVRDAGSARVGRAGAGQSSSYSRGAPPLVAYTQHAHTFNHGGIGWTTTIDNSAGF